LFLGNSLAFGINDNKEIVGVSDSILGVEHAFVFDPAIGVMKDLGSLIPFTMLPGTPDPSRARGINNRGDIVGEATAVDKSGNLVKRAFLLPNGAFSMRDLGTLLVDPLNPGAFLGDSSAFGINDAGTIVGESDTGTPTSPNKTPAFFNAGSSPSGMFPSIGAAKSVEQNNAVVGFIGDPPIGGFMFQSTLGSIDLTTQLGIPGTAIIQAVAINISRQIAAIANNGTTTIAVLLTP
jgi:probable HAF family extracellular repeat protein